jgi:hypothetical protein
LKILGGLVYNPPVLVTIPIHPMATANIMLPIKIIFGFGSIGSSFGYNLAGLGILTKPPDADLNNEIQIDYCSHSTISVNNNCFIVREIQFI